MAGGFIFTVPLTGSEQPDRTGSSHSRRRVQPAEAAHHRYHCALQGFADVELLKPSQSSTPATGRTVVFAPKSIKRYSPLPRNINSYIYTFS
jgi:hypothetical protein